MTIVVPDMIPLLVVFGIGVVLVVSTGTDVFDVEATVGTLVVGAVGNRLDEL